MGLPCEGFIWECPLEKPQLHLLQQYCPRWRSEPACSRAQGSQQHSEDLQKDTDTHVQYDSKGALMCLCCFITLCVVLTLAAVALRALLWSAAPLRAAAAGAA